MSSAAWVCCALIYSAVMRIICAVMATNHLEGRRMIPENRTDWSMRQFVDDLHYMLFMHSVTSHEASFRMRARGVPEDVARRVISSVEPHNQADWPYSDASSYML